MVKLINLAVAAVAFMQIAAPPVSASQIHDVYRAHTAACIGLFFSDKAAHTAQCLPNNSPNIRSEEHTSELQSLMRISYAVFCLKKKRILNYIKHIST